MQYRYTTRWQRFEDYTRWIVYDRLAKKILSVFMFESDATSMANRLNNE